MKNIAIVTGASSGFGKEFVKLFVRRKDIDEVWVVSRNEDRLNKIKEHFGKKIKVFSMDLSVKDNIKTFGTLEELKKCNIKYLVNNAGFAKFCSYDDISPICEYFLSIISPSFSVKISIGSPSLILRVRLISFGTTTLPRSSILLTIPVAFMLISSNANISIFVMELVCGKSGEIFLSLNSHFFYN